MCQLVSEPGEARQLTASHNSERDRRRMSKAGGQGPWGWRKSLLSLGQVKDLGTACQAFDAQVEQARVEVKAVPQAGLRTHEEH